jgi:hypothetical protein
MTGWILQATASDVPLNLPKPDGQPGDTKKPVKVYILAGQSNMVGMGNITGARCPYSGIYLTADPGASIGPSGIYLGGSTVNHYKIAPLGTYVSAEPNADKGAKAALFQGAYDAKADYTRLAPETARHGWPAHRRGQRLHRCPGQRELHGSRRLRR